MKYKEKNNISYLKNIINLINKISIKYFYCNFLILFFKIVEHNIKTLSKRVQFIAQGSEKATIWFLRNFSES